MAAVVPKNNPSLPSVTASKRFSTLSTPPLKHQRGDGFHLFATNISCFIQGDFSRNKLEQPCDEEFMDISKEHISKQKPLIGDPVLRPDRTCAYLGISRATLWRLVKAGKLPQPLNLTSHARGWRLSELEKFLQDARGL
jgi:prophage regulatory protein